MYSIILDVADAANNSRFARQFVLYDPVSTITIDNDSKLYVSSAIADADFKWQHDTQDEHGNGPPLNVTWSGHFRNKFHEDNKLLNKVKSFHATAMDGMYHKDIEDTYDDLTGQRTTRAIQNKHGIISFEITHRVDHEGGRSFQDIPTTGWTNVTNISNEFQIINAKRSNGDTVKIWVRAKDIMGNVRNDFTVVHIDTSPPIISTSNIEDNVQDTKYDFGSR